jgi:hypothetical protein
VAEPTSIWRGAVARTRELLLIHAVVAIVLAGTLGVLPCATDKDQPCDVRTPLWTVLIAVGWLVLVLLFQWAFLAPRRIAALAQSANQELAEKLERSRRKREIREGLADLYRKGDQAWNAASMESQLWERDEKQRAAAVRHNQTPPQPSFVYESWKTIGRWLDEVEQYLRSVPELGQSYVDLFTAQEPTLLAERSSKRPRFSTGVSTQTNMKLVRLKQEKLKSFMNDFRD